MARVDGEREDHFFCQCSHIVQLIIYIIGLATPLPELARVGRLIFLGGLDDARELLRHLGPDEQTNGLGCWWFWPM
jgi:hypothetical protein